MTRPLAALLGTTALIAGALPAQAQDATPEAVVATYAEIGRAMYEDSLSAARELDRAIDAFLADPSAGSHRAAKKAWLAARVPYQQTEVFRFGNGVIDAWEGRVNAWPLDEGLIDYVDTTAYGDVSPENAFYSANVVANETLNVGGREIDAGTIDAALLAELHEIDEIEANVSRGYHAIEFLLWGQDLNGTGPGAGQRSWTDYASGEACTHGHCDRRGAYLAAATDLLIADLEEAVGYWQEGGAARVPLVSGDPTEGLRVILTGLGSLSYGELAGERMQLGLLLHDPEEEHDCFADNTHNSHYDNQIGMIAVAEGRYERTDGSVVEGPGVQDLVAQDHPEVAQRLDETMAATREAMQTMKDRADQGVEAYDQMIAPANAEGNAVVQTVIDRLKTQTRAIEDVIAALDLGAIEIEGSDSLDNPDAVFFQ